MPCKIDSGGCVMSSKPSVKDFQKRLTELERKNKDYKKLQGEINSTDMKYLKDDDMEREQDRAMYAVKSDERKKMRKAMQMLLDKRKELLRLARELTELTIQYHPSDSLITSVCDQLDIIGATLAVTPVEMDKLMYKVYNRAGQDMTDEGLQFRAASEEDKPVLSSFGENAEQAQGKNTILATEGKAFAEGVANTRKSAMDKLQQDKELAVMKLLETYADPKNLLKNIML